MPLKFEDNYYQIFKVIAKQHDILTAVLRKHQTTKLPTPNEIWQDYVFIGIGLCVCVCVYHDNMDFNEIFGSGWGL